MIPSEVELEERLVAGEFIEALDPVIRSTAGYTQEMIELAPPCCITIIALLLRQAWAGLTKQRVAMGAQFRRTYFKLPKTNDELLAWANTFETETQRCISYGCKPFELRQFSDLWDLLLQQNCARHGDTAQRTSCSGSCVSLPSSTRPSDST